MASSSIAAQNPTQRENAFDQIAPTSAPKSKDPWDIFINHRGPDVKQTLATHIHRKLDSMGLHVFLDVEALEAGDSIPAEIQHAITTSTLHIAIFSPNYAQSPWCLAELSLMFKTGKTIIPIFYHVDPSDLKYIEPGKGKYGDAFSEHERKGRYTPEKLRQWKEALHKTSFLSGFLIINNEDEDTVTKKVVNRALQIMGKAPLWVAEHPLGLDELVQGFESVAGEGEEEVKIRGIVGMGGSGKTTLAKELFNRNSSSFERRSFVFDVRDAASRNALPDKQKTLLGDLNFQHSPFDHVDQGKGFLANRLSSHRVLIVLDDVDHIDHLNALLPNKDKLGVQSMVIVTTREMGVLISWGISLSCIFKMPGLNLSLAQQLFCYHAFLQPSPPAEFKTLVEDFVKACNGLPLSLKVFGAQLYGRKSRDYWISQLQKILRILPGEIQQRLQISYDALDEEEREMFLDVACFLIGIEESTAISLWDGSSWSGLYGLESLVNKCLVELVEEAKVYGRSLEGEEKVLSRMFVKKSTIIRMHDHLRDMGREIANRQSPYRLWCPRQIGIMKKHSMERELIIRGIQSADTLVAFKEYMHQLMGISIRESKRLRFSNGLQILSVKGNEFTEEYASLSEDLLWLRWEQCPLRNVPSWLTLKNLKLLELHSAHVLEELWQDDAELPLQLTDLNLSFCIRLSLLPDGLGNLTRLRSLNLESCTQLSMLPDSLSQLIHLTKLELPRCERLFSLPDGFGNLTSLRSLNLEFCEELSMLPDSLSQLIHLTDLNLSYCTRLSSLPDGFGNLTSLRSLNLRLCRQLSMLPDSLSQLIHLTDLNLLNCERLSSLPDGFGNLTSLRSLNLRYCGELSMLPDSLSQLIHLTDLNLSWCTSLSSLPDGFGNLTSLRSLSLESCEQLSMLPDSLSQLIHLTKLELHSERLSSLPDGFGNLTSLTKLELCSKRLSSLPDGFGNLTSLRSLNLSCCRQLSMLPDSLSQLIHLLDLDLSCCERLSSLPDGFSNLTSLRSLSLKSCKQLSMLPDSLSQLIHLTKLELPHCERLSSLPDGFGNLTSLRSLNLERCTQLSMLPDSLSQLIHLTDLNLSFCESLSSLPDGFGNLTSLRSLNLKFCEELSMLPDSLSQLIHLTYLNLSHGRLSLLPDGFGNLTSLRNIHLRCCWQLSMLPDSFSQLIHLTGLDLKHCPMLSSLHEILPVSLNHLSIVSCRLLKNVRCISGLKSLEKLEIGDCLQIEELPSFTDLASLKNIKMWNCPEVEKMEGLEHVEEFDMRDCPKVEKIGGLEHVEKFDMRDCPKVEKIGGLEHAKSLKKLTAKTRWKVAGIQSLGNVERLEELRLECETISALKPCIQSTKGKECARGVWIKGSAIRLEEPFVNRLEEFSDLQVSKPPDGDGDSDDSDEFSDEFPDADCIPDDPVEFPGVDDTIDDTDVSYLYYVEKEEGNGEERKVVCICYTEHEDHELDYDFPPKRAIKVSGKRERVLEAFYQLVEILE